MSPELARLGHVALETPNIDESAAFFRDAVGLEEVTRSDGTIYLRAVDEFDHHSMSLTEADSEGVDHIGWQTKTETGLSEFASQLEDQGIDITWIDAGEEAGQGKAIRFSTPTGNEFEFYHEMEKPDPPEERRSKLKNRTYSPTKTNPIAPSRIDHVQIWDPDANKFVEWLKETLGFRVHEYYDRRDGSRWGTWMSASETKIEAAIIDDEEQEKSPALHHVAYKVETANDLFDAKDAMNEEGYTTDGIGQHSISRGKFLYARDSATNHRIEFNSGSYLVFDPNWEPIAWQEGYLEDEDPPGSRQWVGQIESKERVFY
ncbi:VOC family protein [Halorubrum vacuolatum]|uniref:Catechol 2,3-dioxygenase n=1 Tax=Halorubrum vacuolatum TaxID=63740 RepID=A0A238Y7W2_HALVU|nr:VOC family protein [Halorubrum vacuolatum]SNR66918.1 catechol 2,3-dioxygenase [Halorubrum vacuolatum]